MFGVVTCKPDPGDISEIEDVSSVEENVEEISFFELNKRKLEKMKQEQGLARP